MTDKQNVIKEIAKEYRDAQAHFPIKPPCVNCSDIRIYLCTQIPTKTLVKRKVFHRVLTFRIGPFRATCKVPFVSYLEKCARFNLYVVGDASTAPDRAKPGGAVRRKAVIL